MNFLHCSTKETDDKDISSATKHIPQDSLADFDRLLKIIVDSGVYGFAALAALYRWIRGRPQYEPIYNGLERYFSDDGR